jgi:hypothetical protein
MRAHGKVVLDRVGIVLIRLKPPPHRDVSALSLDRP